jgi:hypothetical protein
MRFLTIREKHPPKKRMPNERVIPHTPWLSHTSLQQTSFVLRGHGRCDTELHTRLVRGFGHSEECPANNSPAVKARSAVVPLGTHARARAHAKARAIAFEMPSTEKPCLLHYPSIFLNQRVRVVAFRHRTDEINLSNIAECLDHLQANLAAVR